MHYTMNKTGLYRSTFDNLEKMKKLLRWLNTTSPTSIYKFLPYYELSLGFYYFYKKNMEFFYTIMLEEMIEIFLLNEKSFGKGTKRKAFDSLVRGLNKRLTREVSSKNNLFQ